MGKFISSLGNLSNMFSNAFRFASAGNPPSSSKYAALSEELRKRRKGRSPGLSLSSVRDTSSMVRGGGRVTGARGGGGGGGLPKGGKGGKGSKKALGSLGKKPISLKAMMQQSGVSDKDLLKSRVNFFNDYQNMLNKENLTPEQAAQKIFEAAEKYAPKLKMTKEDFIRKQLYSYSIQPGDKKQDKFLKWMQVKDLPIEQLQNKVLESTQRAFETPSRRDMDPFDVVEDGIKVINKAETARKREVLKESFEKSPFEKLFGTEEPTDIKPNTIRYKEVDDEFNIIDKETELSPEKFDELKKNQVIDEYGNLIQHKSQRKKQTQFEKLFGSDEATEDETDPDMDWYDQYKRDNGLTDPEQNTFQQIESEKLFGPDEENSMDWYEQYKKDNDLSLDMHSVDSDTPIVEDVDDQNVEQMANNFASQLINNEPVLGFEEEEEEINISGGLI